jgi:HD-like signal output (HDOD) protein
MPPHPVSARPPHPAPPAALQAVAGGLAAPPAPVRAALVELNRPDASMRRAADALRDAPEVAARLVRLAAGGYREPASSPLQAMVRLGGRAACGALLAAQAEAEAARSLPAYGLGRGVFVAHAVRVAELSVALAEWLCPSRTGCAYTCGLVHDLGKIVVQDAIVALGVGVRLAGPDTGRDERRAAGASHEEVGAWLAQVWSCGEDVVWAVAAHHLADPPEDALGRVLWLADRIAHGEGPDPERREAARQAARALDIGPERLARIAGVDLAEPCPLSGAERAALIAQDRGAMPEEGTEALRRAVRCLGAPDPGEAVRMARLHGWLTV